MAVSYLPFSEAMCPKVVSRFEVHCSIARAINRKLNATFSAKVLHHPNAELPVISELFLPTANELHQAKLSSLQLPVISKLAR